MSQHGTHISLLLHFDFKNGSDEDPEQVRRDEYLLVVSGALAVSLAPEPASIQVE
jgi:hypothetical protein